jgi:hypothetical protein
MPKKRKAPPADDRLATAIELLQQLIERFQSENRKYWVFCEVNMDIPLDFCKEDCALRCAAPFLRESS